MQILYISNEYPPETGFGGIATYTKNMAQGMSLLGHDVHVICRSSTGTRHWEMDGAVSIHRTGPGQYPLPASDAFYLFRKVCRRLIPHSLERLAWAREAFRTLQSIVSSQGDFDIIEYPECGGEGFYVTTDKNGVSVARLHTPWELVASFDGIRENAVEKMLLSHLDRASVLAASGVSCPTQSLADLIKKRWHLDRVSVFPNPVTADDFPLSSGDDWIYTGRVERRKGVHVLIQAYANLRASINVTPPLLRIVGRPYGSMNGIDYGEYIDDLIRKNNLTRAIEWIRGTDHESVKRYLARSSVAIFPSLWENLSYSCLEAMASGCAVVASRCGGFTEIIRHGENGLLCGPGDPDELTQMLSSLCKTSGMQAALGAAARTTVQKTYDTAVVCKRAEKWYQTVRNSTGTKGKA
jgi:glycosyltransferase involved in cell wall biosynthesis